MRPGVAGRLVDRHARRHCIVGDHGVVRHVAGDGCADGNGVKPTAGRGGQFEGRDRRRGRCAQRIGERAHGCQPVLAAPGQSQGLAPDGNQQARPVRIGEEGDGLHRLHQQHQIDALEIGLGHLAEIHHLVRREPAGAARLAGCECVNQYPVSSRVQPPGGGQGGLVTGAAPQQQHGLLGRPQNQGHVLHNAGGHRRLGRAHHLGARDAGLQPGAVGWQDQACRTARWAIAGGDGLRSPRPHLVGALGSLDPQRIGRGERRNIGVQRRVVLAVIGGVVADHIDDGGEGAPGVVQVGRAVGVAWTQVQQGAGRPARHAAITVRRPGGHALEQTEHRTHPGLAVQGRDELHLAGAGVGEAGRDPVVGQGGDECVGAVHGRFLLVVGRAAYCGVASAFRRRSEGCSGGTRAGVDGEVGSIITHQYSLSNPVANAKIHYGVYYHSHM